ncbi:polysaccharide deacetylase family protein [Riemerella anatipestifer]|uniref:polysaccharide deacetylase family protein n=1 Tax=Riemerella anatipestifer TaxID=34085 RepID=UPI0030C3AA86
MVLLSFDIEEFDMPLEYQGGIPFEEQLKVSQEGLKNILEILKKYQIKATFFSTVVFAENSQDLIHQLLSEGHELASHTWYHSHFDESDLKTSRERLSTLFNTEVVGLRMPRMQPIKEEEVEDAGYLYNSSINPTFLPGRYNNLHFSKTYFKEGNVWQIPASVSLLRVPLFWLSFHNFPIFIYQLLTNYALKRDGYLNIYFHPWEFSNISKKSYKLPSYTTKNTGELMVKRFDNFVSWLKNKGETFVTYKEFLAEKTK